jgi:phosphoenolpyruvate-protein kinase (PTS system EI component)
VGTNDLGQYLFAADRTSLEKVSAHTVMTPAMLRALKQIVDHCRAGNCNLAVCGEAAGTVPVVALLVGLGFRELSMTPARATAVHYGLQQLELKAVEALAEEALTLRQEKEVVTLVKERLPPSLFNLGAKLEV